MRHAPRTITTIKCYNQILDTLPNLVINLWANYMPKLHYDLQHNIINL